MELARHLTDLRNMVEGTIIDREAFLVKSITKLTTGKGDPYYDCTLVNKFGGTGLKIWDISHELTEGDFVELYATCNKHPKFGMQWKVSKYYKLDNFQSDQEFDSIIYKPPVDKLFDEMVNYPYNNYTVECLREVLLADKELVSNFKRVPASLANHHSYDGGLVQHTYEVWAMTSCILDTVTSFTCYPKVQKDVALFGALVHDISKVYEYNWNDNEKKYDRSNASILVGNPAGGLIVLTRWQEQLSGRTLDDKVIDLLQHIFVSHQMRPEWGSPVSPRCLEALAVATADGMSANISHIDMGLEQDKTPNDPFTSPYFFYMGNASIWKTPDFDPNSGRTSTGSSSSAVVPSKTGEVKKEAPRATKARAKKEDVSSATAKEIPIVLEQQEALSKKKGLIS